MFSQFFIKIPSAVDVKLSAFLFIPAPLAVLTPSSSLLNSLSRVRTSLDMDGALDFDFQGGGAW